MSAHDIFGAKPLELGAAKKRRRYGKAEKTGNGLPPPVPSHEFALRFVSTIRRLLSCQSK